MPVIRRSPPLPEEVIAIEAAHSLASERQTFGLPPQTRVAPEVTPAQHCPAHIPGADRVTLPSGLEDAPGVTAGSGVAPGSAKPSPQALPFAPLSERQCRILEFERHWWRYAGAKETAIRAEFGVSATRYYQILNALIDSPAALVADPMLVKRLRRLRATRRQARTGAGRRLDTAEM